MIVIKIQFSEIIFMLDTRTDSRALGANFSDSLAHRCKKKNKWTFEEDNLLREAVQQFGCQNWGNLAKCVPGRTGKQCRERWLVGLDPSINKDSWTKEEDDTLLELQEKYGNKWSKFLPFLTGRSSSAVKNRWSLLSRRQISDQMSNRSNSVFIAKSPSSDQQNEQRGRQNSVVFDGKSWEQLDYLQEGARPIFEIDAMKTWFE